MTQIIFPTIVVCSVCAALFGLVWLAANAIVRFDEWRNKRKTKIY